MSSNSDLEALISSLYANQDDDLTRLVLADWLAERGEFEKEAKIRDWINVIKPRIKEMWKEFQFTYDINGHDNKYLWMIVVQEIYNLIAETLELKKINIIEAELGYYELMIPKFRFPTGDLSRDIRDYAYYIIETIYNPTLNKGEKLSLIRESVMTVVHICYRDYTGSGIGSRLNKIRNILLFNYMTLNPCMEIVLPFNPDTTLGIDDGLFN